MCSFQPVAPESCLNLVDVDPSTRLRHTMKLRMRLWLLISTPVREKAPNSQPSAALVRPVPVPLTPFLSPSEYPWSDSERRVTNALLGLFANFRLSIRILSLAVWLKAGTNVRKWLRLLRFSFSSPYEVCFMEKKKEK